jgi:Amidases related to nicotinamidase
MADPKTSPLILDPRTTALVLIDLQEGIVARDTKPYPTRQIIDEAVRLGRRCNEVGAPIFPVHVTTSPGGADRLSQPIDSQMAVAANPPANWADLVPDVAALQAAKVITKRQWGAFYGTELDLQLRRRGITTIILAGIATNFGVESTAREAWQHNYAVVIAEDACTSLDAGMHEFSIEKILPRIARIRSTDDILAAL